jgi:hypothetical protein
VYDSSNYRYVLLGVALQLNCFTERKEKGSSIDMYAVCTYGIIFHVSKSAILRVVGARRPPLHGKAVVFKEDLLFFYIEISLPKFVHGCKSVVLRFSGL